MSPAFRILFATEVQQVSKEPNQTEMYNPRSHINYIMWFEKGLTIIQSVKQQDNFSHYLSHLKISDIYKTTARKIHLSLHKAK